MSILGNLRLDVGDDDSPVSSSGVTQSAGSINTELINNLRVDVGDDLGIPADSRFIYAPSGAADNSVVRFDGTTGQYVQDSSVLIDDSGDVTIAGDLTVLGLLNYPNFRLVTGAGNITVNSTDNVIFINKAVSEPTTITIPNGFRAGHLLVIKDFKGDARTNNITLSGNIDGLSSFVMRNNWQSITLISANTSWGII